MRSFWGLGIVGLIHVDFIYMEGILIIHFGESLTFGNHQTCLQSLYGWSLSLSKRSGFPYTRSIVTIDLGVCIPFFAPYR